ncbi:Sodium/calcium exchanger protein-domain-containing protein [Apiosordaria backusii]|uniref:Sodium/calcium exchanger protein-domain-containing protein n=1 Tax=Apiosordaria backusii TaxID=314023 RepID=A0AA40ETH6_9PEZI|nr:Sodium/calcium exchanger protein-domain-containing protein [Apiosordaria backusii]
MTSYNTWRTKQAAYSAAWHSSKWNIFPHSHNKHEHGAASPAAWRSANDQDLEGHPLSPAETSPLRPSDDPRTPGVFESIPLSGPGSSSRDGRAPDTADSQPGSGETFVDSRPPSGGEQGVTTGAINTLDATRRRNTAGRGAGNSTTADEGAAAAGGKKKENKSRTFFKRIEPKEPFTVRNQIQRTLFGSWINALLIAAPIGIAIANIHSVSRVAVFVVNFMAIVPLAAMLGFATEEIALRTGETVGGLLNATFGNAVELIVAIIALADRQVVIVQTSLIGSILSNLLLVMGMCFFFGGLRRQEQFFNTTVAQTAASLLALAVASVIVPTVFDLASLAPESDVAKLSRGTSVILLFVYGAYLFFQLKTHSMVFAEESQKVQAKPFKRALPELPEGAIAQGFVTPAGIISSYGLPDSERSENEKIREAVTKPPMRSASGGEQTGGEQSGSDGEDDLQEEPQLHFIVAVATLAASTVVIAVCAEYMVDSISAITASGVVSEEFVGLILLPIVGNAAEHATAVTVAIKDKMDLAIGVAVGSSMQVALFIIPLLVIIGWGMGIDAMTLSFDPFQVAVLFVAVLLVNYLINDGKSHWLEGMLLMCLYAIIAVCSWCKSSLALWRSLFMES